MFQVLYLHILLGLQNLLCVWFYDAGPGHPLHRDSLCHHCLHVLLAQCWGLQMVSGCGTSLFQHLLIMWKVWLTLICFLLGNGQVFSLLHPLLFMFTCTRFTTTSLKLSKFMVYFDLWYIKLYESCHSHLRLDNISKLIKWELKFFWWNQVIVFNFFLLGCTGCSRHPSTLATWLCSVLL